MQLLQAIQRGPGRRVNELAEECGIPLNTARDHLRVLEDEGLIRSEQVQVGTRGRPPIVFHAVSDADTSTAADARVAGARMRGRMLRAITGGTGLDVAAEQQLDVLYEHLDDAGLEPDVDERKLSFDLAPCRYHDMIDEDQALVCGVHARLVADVLRQTEGPLRVEVLQPFVTAHQCRLQLSSEASELPPLENRTGVQPGP